MSDEDFIQYQNLEAARAALDLFESLGCKFACVVTNQAREIKVVFMPTDSDRSVIDESGGSAVILFYALDLNRDTVIELLAQAIGQGADYSSAIPGINYIP
jgi:hypothetical protein